MNSIFTILDSASSAREDYFDRNHASAFRLLNGFLEGIPTFCIDIYAKTALIHNYASTPNDEEISTVRTWIINKLPWVNCIILKTRNGSETIQKRGRIIFGDKPDTVILENGIIYSIDLTMNRDASFYLDTRNLRTWSKDNLSGKTVLNTFAFTGSLGIAALAGGASRAVQLDRNNSFLNIARKSYLLNNLKVVSTDFIAKDFFTAVGNLKHNGQTFDCVFLDPPFFSSTPKGTVDLVKGNGRLINKVRPLIVNDGWLISINNSLFVSGKEYMDSLTTLCSDGFLSLEKLIPVPLDFTGIPETRLGSLPVDPSPFNHSTKIAILRVHRKS